MSGGANLPVALAGLIDRLGLGPELIAEAMGTSVGHILLILGGIEQATPQEAMTLRVIIEAPKPHLVILDMIDRRVQRGEAPSTFDFDDDGDAEEGEDDRLALVSGDDASAVGDALDDDELEDGDDDELEDGDDDEEDEEDELGGNADMDDIIASLTTPPPGNPPDDVSEPPPFGDAMDPPGPWTPEADEDADDLDEG